MGGGGLLKVNMIDGNVSFFENKWQFWWFTSIPLDNNNNVLKDV